MVQKFKRFIYGILFATTSTLLAVPQNHLPQGVFQDGADNYQQEAKEWFFPNTYDGILRLLEELESGEAERKYSLSQLDKINSYLITLSKEGLLPNEFAEEDALQEDVYDLVYGEDSVYQLRFLGKGEDPAFPLVLTGTVEDQFLPCGKISHAWKKTKKFVKKHKKEIIIGSVVVVAVAAVTVAVVVASSSAATSAASAAAGAAGTAAGAGAGSLDSSHSESKKTEAKKESPLVSTAPKEALPPLDTKEAAIMKAILDEHVASFKEFLVEDKTAQEATGSKEWDEMSFGEKAREVGSGFAHKALEEVTDLVKVFPQLCEEVKELGSRFLPESLSELNPEDPVSPIENYESLLAKGHEIIDKVFSTDQAELFTAEARADDPMNNFAIGIIPIPGMISKNGNINVKAFSKLGRSPDRAGFTKSGRGSMKHGYRTGRTVFEKPVGTPTQINDHGQKVLDNILNHPEKKVVQYTHDMYGPVIEIEAPDLGGVRFTGDAKEMMGFLEPKWFKK